MLAAGIRYLTGYCVATAPDDYGRAEWPPHPARVFMALAAAHFEAPPDDPDVERESLEWLQSQPPPTIIAGRCEPRSVVDVYVPPNDFELPQRSPDKLKSKAITAAMNVLPMSRKDRQARTFPAVWLEHDTVHLLWPQLPSVEQAAALDALCRRVTRIGHSSSLVQMWMEPNDVAAVELTSTAGRVVWQADEHSPDLRLRKMAGGLLGYLEAQYQEDARKRFETATRKNEQIDASVAALKEEKKSIKGKGSRDKKAAIDKEIDQLSAERLDARDPGPPVQPHIGITAGYRNREPKRAEVPGTCFDPRLVVLRIRPVKTRFRRLELQSTLPLTTAIHKALVSQTADDPAISRLTCGLEPDGKPTTSPHIALFPVPFVGHEHADGHLLGISVALPNDVDPPQRRAIMQAIDQLTETDIRLGRLGRWRLEFVLRDALPPASNLRAERWTAAPDGAYVWASVTPAALDRHPKAKDRAARDTEIADALNFACERVGLRDLLASVRVSAVPAHMGAPHGRAFPRLSRKDGSLRRHTHVILEFSRPVVGPIALCAGRYRGYGLLRPVSEWEFSRWR